MDNAHAKRIPLLNGTIQCRHINAWKDDSDVNVWLEASLAPEAVWGIKLYWDVLYHIRDFSTPQSPEAFREMCKELVKYLEEGKSINITCHGGHGRSGMVAATLVGLTKPMLEDPIAWLRDTLCPKQCETREQEKFVFKALEREVPSTLTNKWKKEDEWKSTVQSKKSSKDNLYSKEWALWRDDLDYWV